MKIGKGSLSLHFIIHSEKKGLVIGGNVNQSSVSYFNLRTKSIKHLAVDIEPNRAVLVGENEDILVVASCQAQKYLMLKFVPQEITIGEWNLV